MRIGDLLAQGGRSFSFEFFPPKDEAGEEVLWRSISELEPLRPTFVSVTYGAGGTTRDRTVAITGRIARETSMLPMAHLTCVGHTTDELTRILALAPGVRRAQRARPARRPARRTRHAVGGDRGRDRLRLGAGRLRPLGQRPVRRGGRLPGGPPRRRHARRGRGRAQGQARRGCGVRDHRDGAARLRLLRPGRARPGRGRRLPDHPGHHADPELRLDGQDGRAVRAGDPGRGDGTARAAQGRPGRRTRRGDRDRHRALRHPARRRRPGPALLHAEPVEGDARDLRGARRCTPEA